MKKKKVAILQSNYIPWKGYFDMIHMVDEFVLYDDMQYTKRDWRNRNLIKTHSGLKWLTIPVVTKGRFDQKIKETEILSSKWCMEHWKSLQVNYAKTPCFDIYAGRILEIYKRCQGEKYLSRVNYIFLKEICDILGISTEISWSSDYILNEGKTEKLVGICVQAGADEYISGPAAKDYIVPEAFAEAGIRLKYMDYSNYREYPQLYGQFCHNVSILDMLFHLGENTFQYIESIY
ncbi:MAG: WbqC family protein [Lachnospiraceae bacterium]|nr:WbqC family protein [Lachnospiraceae bacterium]